MKNLRFTDIIEAWKLRPAWVRAFVWVMCGVIVGTFLKG